jgi:hypothetical protein
MEIWVLVSYKIAYDLHTQLVIVLKHWVSNLGLIKFYITLRRIYSYHATHLPPPPFPGKANGPCLNRKLLLTV